MSEVILPQHDDESVDDDCDDGQLEEEDESIIISNAQRAYVENNNSKKHLFLMCIGLVDDGGTPVLDLDVEPWSGIKKRDIKPARTEYAEEIVRRSKLMSTTADRVHQQHKPANWSLTKCVEWLQEHPVVDQQDISFLKNEVQRVKAIILNAQREQAEEEARQTGGQWRGSIPYMRLIMCLTEDDIKAAFLRRADTRTRHQLDARNSDVRPPTAFELIADRWNDEHFNPIAAVSECHEDFSVPTNSFFASSKTGRSGQGEGGRHAGTDDDEEQDGREESDDPEEFIIFDTSSVRFGSLSRTSRSECALQNRAAFLCGKPSYLLYSWEVADRHQLLQSALQRLDDDVGASDASSAPSATSSTNQGTRRRRQREQPTAPYRDDIFDLSQSIRFLSKAEDDRQVRRRISELQDEARRYRRMYAESDDPNSARARFYLEEAQQIAREIESLEEPLIATPISRNGTPRTPRTP
ncbi:hypothetical protein MHU86_9361 [Fragilaria crotonensis]|nr:hypothetical protein MHU86_9361 [Fragilaria crotonensis]